MAIDTASVITFFTNGSTDITQVDPTGKYSSMSISIYTNNNNVQPLGPIYTASPGEYLTPTDVSTILNGVFNNFTTSASTTLYQIRRDGLDDTTNANTWLAAYNGKAAVYGLVATLRRHPAV